jgi:hypothetical protein
MAMSPPPAMPDRVLAFVASGADRIARAFQLGICVATEPLDHSRQFLGGGQRRLGQEQLVHVGFEEHAVFPTPYRPLDAEYTPPRRAGLEVNDEL